MAELIIGKYVVLVDDADIAKVSGVRWRVRRDKRLDGRPAFYVEGRSAAVSLRM